MSGRLKLNCTCAIVHIGCSTAVVITNVVPIGSILIYVNVYMPTPEAREPAPLLGGGRVWGHCNTLCCTALECQCPNRIVSVTWFKPHECICHVNVRDV